MAKHEFGIMKKTPKNGVRYDEYEPQKYHCIAIDDSLIEAICGKLAHIDMYWHSIDRKEKGLAYCGITLIPPTSMDDVIDVIGEIDELAKLKNMMESARQNNEFVIHFGL